VELFSPLKRGGTGGNRAWVTKTRTTEGIRGCSLGGRGGLADIEGTLGGGGKWVNTRILHYACARGEKNDGIALAIKGGKRIHKKEAPVSLSRRDPLLGDCGMTAGLTSRNKKKRGGGTEKL